MSRHGDITASDPGNEIYKSSETSKLGTPKKAEKVLRGAKSLRKVKRKEIKDEHQKRRQELKLRINEHFELRRINVNKVQNDAWEKLIALNSKRQLVEGLIIDSTKKLESATFNLTRQLLTLFDAQIESHMKINLSA